MVYINVRQEKNSCPTSLEVDAPVITDAKVLSGNFNDYFATIVDKILEKRKLMETNYFVNFSSTE